MGRRRSQLVADDFSSSDSEAPDGLQEATAQGQKRKRKPRAFDDDLEDELMAEAEARGRQRAAGPSVATYLKKQAFVPARTGVQQEAGDAEELSSDSDDDEEEHDATASEAADEGPPSAPLAGIGHRADVQRDPDLNDPPSGSSRSGIGSSSRAGIGSSSRAGIGGNSRAGIGGNSRAGIGAARPAEHPPPPPSSSRLPQFTPAAMTDAGVPSSFSATPNVVPSDAFARDRKPSEQKQKRSFLTGHVPHTDIKFGGGLGGGFNPAAYLASMGWEGGGLGERGEGIEKPIEVQLRPERAGIAFGGRREKTKQERSKDAPDDDIEDLSRRKGEPKATSGTATPVDRPWTKKSRPRKPAVRYQTYDEIIEAAGEAGGAGSGPQQIIDARGKASIEVSSIASALSSHPVPSSDSTRLPELRHNLRLITEESKRTLDAFAKEGADIVQRRSWLKRERDESARRKARETTVIAKLRAMQSVIGELDAIGRQSLADTSISLTTFSPHVARLQEEQTEADIAAYGLDEALVGAIAPLFKRKVMSWSPLDDASIDGSMDLFGQWQKILRTRSTVRDSASADRALVHPFAPASAQKSRPRTVEMLPWDALLWHLWLPKVRSALNNDWKPHHPKAAVALLAGWQPLLPQYLWDNVVDQILLPKLQRTVEQWELRSSKASLHHILFPWLPLLGNRLDDCMAEARRRLRSALKLWKMRESPSAEAEERDLRRDVGHWREMFPSKHDFDSMMLVCIVPKLSTHLQRHCRVNPRKQDMSALERVLAWGKLIRPSVLCRLLEAEFFPKWLTTLHSWLIQPGVDLGQVAEWYSFWKSWFRDHGGLDVDGREAMPGKKLHGFKTGFDKGIQLISAAIELGEDDQGRKDKLPMPDLKPSSRSTSTTVPEPKRGEAGKGNSVEAVSFRSIVEERLLEADVLVVPLHSAHEATGKRLLRATQAASLSGGAARGSDGAVFYIDDDVVWAQAAGGSKHDFAPVGLDELAKMAKSSPSTKRPP